ncbi:hypothetical protein ACFVS2_21910 [Brevibacillus sp. NPDC058079]|uniref:hypothetical protein n=1 Tax=Brevibacillus sp. NPDC058079 TaxID=3346330 RepID=UPI0036EB7A12
MLTVKYIGTIVILLLVIVLYLIKVKKEDRHKYRYILFTSIGFGLMVLPDAIIQDKSVLSIISMVAAIFVGVGLFLYIRVRKSEKKQKKH